MKIVCRRLSLLVSMLSLAYLPLVKADTALDTSAQQIPSVTAQAINLNSTNNVVVITRQQIKTSGASKVSDVLRNQAGIQLNDLYGDNSYVVASMRGFGDDAASNMLILVDGYRITNPDLAIPNINSIPIQEIDHIEIIPGSASILYGEQAVGGIINIVTRKPTHFTAEFNTGYGSYNHSTYGTSIGDAYANGLEYLLNFYKDMTDNYRVHNDQDTTNFSGQAGYQYASGSLLIKYQRYLNNLLYAGALTGEQVATDPRQAQTDTNFSYQINNVYNVGIQQKLGDNTQLQVYLDQRQTDGSGFIFSSFTEKRAISELDPRLTTKIDESLLTAGLDLTHDSYEFNSDLLNVDDTQQQVSPFLQLITPLTQQLELTLGARDAQLNGHTLISGINYPIANSAFVTEQGLSWQLDEQFRLFARREGNYRFPKADEYNSLPTGVSTLKTQTGVSYEIGGEWQKATNSVQITLYQLLLHNEISFDPTQTPTQPFGANTNLDPTRRNGLIVDGQYALNQAVILSGHYSYVDARFMQGPYKNNRVPFVANNLINAGISYKFLQYFTLYAEDNYVGRRIASGDFENANGILGGYSVYNASLSFQKAKWKVSLRVNNIFYKKYNAFTVYDPTSAADYYYPAPGRNFFITASYQIA